MSPTKNQEKTLNSNEQHRSDGRELVPAEVQAHIRHHDEQLTDTPATSGYTTDDEGLVSNYTIEPDIYPEKSPSSQQQRQYIFWGVGAALLVLTLILVAFSIS